MSWSTFVKATLNFNRKTDRDKCDLMQDMKEQEQIMKTAESDLMIYAASNPKVFQNIKDDEGYALEYEDAIRTKVRHAIEAYGEAAVERYRLEVLEENWDNRDGDYVYPEGRPEHIKKLYKDDDYGPEDDDEWDEEMSSLYTPMNKEKQEEDEK